MHLILSLLFALSSPVFAQHDHHGAHMGDAMQMTQLSDGVVKKVNVSAGDVTIQHGQLDSIGMPPMTMSFGVTNKAWLKQLKAGDKIRFSAEMGKKGPLMNRYELAK
jgi:Cu(I)/Ag(I) efflux system protein CusF